MCSENDESTSAGRILLVTLVTMLILGAYRESLAQTAIPGPAQPGLLERRFEKPELPKATEQEIAIPEKEGTAPPPGAEQTMFVVKAVIVEGASVYSPADFLPLYEKLLGTRISIKAIYEIAQAITAKYTADGYLLSQAIIPPQHINGNGIVRITVIEGYIDTVTIHGDAGGSEPLLKHYGEKIRASRPLRLKILERYLLLAGDLPGISASGVLKPSQAPGAAELIFETKYKPFDAFASLDNRGGKYVGPWETTTGINANSLLGLSEQTSVQFVTTPFHAQELKYGRVAHDETIGTEGAKVTADIGNVISHPGSTLKPSAIRSHALSLGGGASYPVIRSRAENLTFRGRLDIKDSSTDQLVDTRVSYDRLRVARGAGSYDWVDTVMGTPSINMVVFEASQGIDALGARPTGSAALSRANGHSNFFKMTGEVTRVQRLYPGISLMLGGSVQWANSALLSGEQFTFGGSQYGRAYDPASLTGDQGMAGKVELQYAGPEVPHIKDWQLYGFYDVGVTRLVSPLVGEIAYHSGAATGVGLRSNVIEAISVNLELAAPLFHSSSACSTGCGVRGFFGLVARY